MYNFRRDFTILSPAHVLLLMHGGRSLLMTEEYMDGAGHLVVLLEDGTQLGSITLC